MKNARPVLELLQAYRQTDKTDVTKLTDASLQHVAANAHKKDLWPTLYKKEVKPQVSVFHQKP